MNTFTLTSEETELLFESVSELKQHTIWKIVCLATDIGDVEFKEASRELHQHQLDKLENLQTKLLTQLN